MDINSKAVFKFNMPDSIFYNFSEFQWPIFKYSFDQLEIKKKKTYDLLALLAETISIYTQTNNLPINYLFYYYIIMQLYIATYKTFLIQVYYCLKSI